MTEETNVSLTKQNFALYICIQFEKRLTAFNVTSLLLQIVSKATWKSNVAIYSYLTVYYESLTNLMELF